jgi:hypothetical protein
MRHVVRVSDPGATTFDDVAAPDRRRGYFARPHTTSATPPAEAVGTLYLNSSPDTENFRFCSVPSQFGNMACSILNTMVPSLTV